MNASAILLAILRFACWEAVLFAASVLIAGLIGWRNNRPPAERCLAVLAIEVTLESSCAAIFSFAGLNSPPAYWIAACLVAGPVSYLATKDRLSKPPVQMQPAVRRTGPQKFSSNRAAALIAALLAPLVLLSFKPVEEIDSINYLHYLIEWLSNRATPYTFATNYVAFWELSFAPAWIITRVDLFFPLLALKAVVLLTLALWLLGKELHVPCVLLLWTVFGCIAMQHFWYGPSGVPTLKNDALHGVGFVMMALAILRAARRRLTSTDIALLAFGAAFGSVKYTGIFVAILAVAVVLLLRMRPSGTGDRFSSSVPADQRPAKSHESETLGQTQSTLSNPQAMLFPATRRFFVLHHRILSAFAFVTFFVLTSGHYYLHNFFQYGSPFYPFQINLAFVHLPGTADLSDTSIVYNLRDSRLWRALFLPTGGLSPAGLLFPVVLAATLLISTALLARATFAWLWHRASPLPLDWAAFFLLCGWLLYFRSVYSASAYGGDLAFILNGLNSIRYVDGVLATSELFLVALLARFTWLALPLVAINLISRLAMLYAKLESYSPLALCAVAALVFLLFLALRRRAIPVALLTLVTLGPFVVERNRERWTTYWNDLKPVIRAVSKQDLAVLALTNGGYFAGHVVAAGSPMDPAVRSLLPEEIDALPPGERPHYLVVLLSPGTEAFANWESRYGPAIGSWGYKLVIRGKSGALFEWVP